MRFVYFFLFFFTTLLAGAQPSDVSLVVVDFKYNESEKVKVCEVQPLRISKLSGYYHTHPEDPSYIKNWLGSWFDSFDIPKWAEARRLGDPDLKKVYHEKFTLLANPAMHLQADEEILSHKNIVPADPYDLNAYTGMMYLTGEGLQNTKNLRQTYPSIVFIDEGLLPLYGDKLQTNTIFDSHEELAGFRPRWQVYKKKYDPSLAQRILEDIGSDTVVIKPRNAARGLGVIIVDGSSLDATLKFILNHADKLKDHDDSSYSYWSKDKKPDFIVEEFIPSDVLEMEGGFYDPTYRFVVLLYYTNGVTYVETIDGYAKLPAKVVNTKGTLNDRHKSCGTLPYYAAIKPSDFPVIEEEVRRCLHLLYAQLLEY